MANYYTGAGASFQVGKETTFATQATPTNAINFLNESISLSVERLTEDSLIVSKTARAMDVMGFSVAGDFSVILKPENIKQLLHLSLGVEDAPTLVPATTGAYSHIFKLIDGETSLPSFTAVIDRKVATPAYTGLKVSSLKLDAKAKDFIRGTISVKGSGKEEVGTLETLPAPTMKAYRFVNGSLTIDGVEFADVSSVGLTIDNTLEDGEQTLGSGYYNSEGQHSERVINLEIECYYNATSNTIRENKYKTDGASASIVLTLESPELIEVGQKHRFIVTLPNVVITEANPNISGKEKIALTLSGQALETTGAEAIEVNVIDGENATSFA